MNSHDFVAKISRLCAEAKHQQAIIEIARAVAKIAEEMEENIRPRSQASND